MTAIGWCRIILLLVESAEVGYPPLPHVLRLGRMRGQRSNDQGKQQMSTPPPSPIREARDPRRVGVVDCASRGEELGGSEGL